MTRRTNARLAGVAFLAYIAFGVTAMVLSGRATNAEGIAAQLMVLAQHAAEQRIAAVLNLACGFMALGLGATLYSLTRDVDADLAMLAFSSRVVEGVVGGISAERTLELLWLATASGPGAPDAGALQAIGAVLLGPGSSPVIAATFFAVGSTLFAWLFLRGRMIPAALAWLGVIASVLLVVGLPLQIAGVVRGVVTQLIWIPMAAFEIPLAVWLLVKGVSPPASRGGR